MTLRSRITFAWLLLVLFFLAAALVCAWDGRRGQVAIDVLLAAALAAGLSWPFVRVFFVRRANRALADAARRHDPATVRRIGAELRAFCPPAQLWLLDLNDAVALLIEERWREALDCMLAIDRSRVRDPRSLVALDNNVAWARLHLGEGEAAVELARGALARAAGGRLRASCLGTLGAALVTANHPNEALTILRQALDSGDATPTSQATRAYWLGEAHRSLGRTDEARAAYERAVREAADSGSGRRARAQLDALGAGPYR